MFGSRDRHTAWRRTRPDNFRVPKLYTYIIPIDDGAAPNPFKRMCTLAICKGVIRRTAEPGDWVAGVGSKARGLNGRLVYAMRVEESIPWQEYEQRARTEWPHRIPNIKSPETWRRLGDCIYYYSKGKVKQRPGVHPPGLQKRDLRGRNVLISRDFYYFGNKAIPLRGKLLEICPSTRGHRSKLNAPYVAVFEKWIRKLRYATRTMHGQPAYEIDWRDRFGNGGCSKHAKKQGHHHAQKRPRHK
jgi:hypothetical protein